MINLNRLELDSKKITLIALVSFLFFYADYTFVIKAQLDSGRKIEKERAKLQLDLDTLTKDLLKMQAAQAKQGPLVKAKRFIAQAQLPELLQAIANLANECQVKIMRVAPSKEAEAKEKGAKDSGAKEGKAAREQKFSLLLIALDLSCDYHRLGEFINGLEREEVFMAVEKLKIAAQAPDYMRQKVELVLRTYVTK